MDRKDLRMCLGHAVAESLRALVDTGVDADSCVHAFWAPTSRRLWTATFPHASSQWSGLLLDTIQSCAVAVVTEKCLIMSKRRATRYGCQNAHCVQADEVSSKNKLPSLFETAMFVNLHARLPCPLRQNSAGRWDLSTIDKGAEFDLGASGKLKFLGPVYGTRGLLMKWSSPGTTPNAKQWVQERLLKAAPKPFHRELVLDDGPAESSIQIHVISCS
ncbi:hypothetical protein BDW74DRAFT_32814 [Aspergillus multicolor]|uniref:uncharacterized protein n=1 Tax=Aspergillus multicolor TaxID=41759 RepID=UPI003CCD4E2A